MDSTPTLNLHRVKRKLMDLSVMETEYNINKIIKKTESLNLNSSDKCVKIESNDSKQHLVKLCDNLIDQFNNIEKYLNNKLSEYDTKISTLDQKLKDINTNGYYLYKSFSFSKECSYIN
jgi:hypothetical protein